jgi:hypothetical protein
MLGGSLNGGKILGKYPKDLTAKSTLDIGMFMRIKNKCYNSLVLFFISSDT